MISNQFCARIIEYLESSNRSLNQALLEEAGKRATFAFQRQLMEEKQDTKGVLRMSSGGQCARKQYYNFSGEKGESLSGRTINTFLFGDLIEVGLSVLGRLAGWQLSGKPEGEDELTIDVNGHKVKGHCDDLLFVPEENKYYLVEYKTMSSWSYEKFEKEGMDDQWGYLSQASLYAHALGIEDIIFVACAKETGHMCDQVVKANKSLVANAISKWDSILKGEVPERGFAPVDETVYNRKTKMRDPTGRSILGINCSYCSFKSACYPQAQTDIKSGKPVFVIGSSMELSV